MITSQSTVVEQMQLWRNFIIICIERSFQITFSNVKWIFKQANLN